MNCYIKKWSKFVLGLIWHSPPLGDLVKYQKFGFPSEVFPLLIKNILFSWQMSPKFSPPWIQGGTHYVHGEKPNVFFWPGSSYLLKWWILINFNGIRWFYLLKYKNLKVLWNQAYFGSFLQKRNFLKITQFFLQKWS